jgi:signal transduction histidine kinase
VNLTAEERTALEQLCSRGKSSALVRQRAQILSRADWDEHRIVQAISNLTANAVRHGTPGTPVRLRLTGDERRVAVEVHNQGTIPEELLPRIFEPFRSGRHYASRGDGLGLGLFIVKAIARAHGGGVEVDSAQGATMFRLVLPRHCTSAAAV